MYLGRYQLGQRVDLRVLCRTGAGAGAALPDDAPVAKVWDADGNRVLVAAMPVVDRYALPGLFHYQLLLGRAFAAGRYSVTYWYANGDFIDLPADTFEVVAGGNADGAVVGMHYYERPHATFIVRQLETGKLVQGRNPKVN